MHRDQIVEEVRKYREENAARFGFDVRKIAEDALKRQASSGHRVVDLSKEGERTGRPRPMREPRNATARAAVKRK
jgi:hypothetical protein